MIGLRVGPLMRLEHSRSDFDTELLFERNQLAITAILDKRCGLNMPALEKVLRLVVMLGIFVTASPA